MWSDVKVITPLDRTIKGVMEFSWPMIVISVLIISSIRITDTVKNKKEFVLYKELLNLFFIIYILCLFQVVTFQDTGNFGSNNLVPFKEIFRYHFGSRLFIKNVIGNLVMFIPYGIFVSIYTKMDKKWGAFLLIAFASISIESTQLAIGRIFDIDDIILNITGGMIGFFIYSILTKIGQVLPENLKKRWMLNILMTLLLVVMFLYLGRLMD